MQENCTDYDGYKKGSAIPEYINKCGKKIYKIDEEMKEKLKCYDEAHSREKCISEKYLDQLFNEVGTYLEETAREPICIGNEKNTLICIKDHKSLYECHPEIDGFLDCVDEAMRNIYGRTNDCNLTK